MAELKSATERALKAKQDMESLFEAAIDEQLLIIKEAQGKLQELGHYQKSGPAKTKRGPSQKEKFCEICNIAGHDKRNHRNQDPLKKFSVKELEERGLPHA